MVTAKTNKWCTGRKPEELFDTKFLLYGADSESTEELPSVMELGASPCFLSSTMSNMNELWARFLMAESN